MAQPVTIRVSRTTVEPSRWPYQRGLGALPVARLRASASFVGLGDASDDLQAQFLQLEQTLHALATSIAAAQATGQTEAVTQLRAQWRAVKAQADAVVAQLHGQEAPSGFALDLASLADFARGLGSKVALVAALGLGLLFLGPRLAWGGGGRRR